MLERVRSGHDASNPDDRNPPVECFPEGPHVGQRDRLDPRPAQAAESTLRLDHDRLTVRVDHERIADGVDQREEVHRRRFRTSALAAGWAGSKYGGNLKPRGQSTADPPPANRPLRALQPAP